MKKTKLLLIAIAMMGILFPLSGSALSGKSPLAGLVFEQIGSEGLTDFVIGEGVGYGGNVSLTGGNTSSNIKTGATNIIYRNVTTNITPTSFLSYSPTFSSLAVNSMTTPGIIKNDERGNFIGGQKITSNDILNASLLSGNGIVFSGSPLNRLLGSENITISLDKNVPTKVSTDGNIIASIMDNTLYLSLKGSTPVVPPAGSGVSYGTGGTVIASIDDGTLANQTARWDNVANKWVGDSSLTNDGTDIGVTNNLTVGGTITINGVTFTNTDVNNWNTTFGWGDHSTAGYFVAGDNISGLTNDAGYITASSADALTNKTGNISMWTNDSGYLTALTLAASETDPIYTAWDKSTGISIISTQVTDFNAAAIAAPLTGFVAGTNAGTITNVDTILSGLQAAQNQIDALGAVSHVAVTLGAVPNGMTLTGQQINLSAADGLGTDGYLSSADWTIFNNKENALIAGAIGEYYRGDKTWQTLDTVAVVENGAGGLYFTDTRAINAVLSTFGGGVNSPIVNTDTIVQALEKAQGQIDAITLNFDENVDDRVAALIIPGASITSIYNDGAGTLTIDTAQDIQTTATPIFAGLTLNGNLNMGANAIVLNGDTVTDFTGTSTPNTFVGLTNQAGGLGVRINNLNLTTTLGGILNTVQPINTTASPQFSGLNILGNIATTGTVDGIDLSVKAIDWDAKLNANLANGLIWVGNAGTPTAVAMSGGATMNNAGVITLDNASVVNQALTGFVAGTNIGSITSADTIISGLKAAQDQIDILAAGVGHAAITVDAAGIANGLSEIGGQVLTLATAGAAQNGALTSADWTTFNSKENAIVAGLATEYWRGDKTWATLDTSVVPENGNLYYTDARARLALSSTGAPLQYNNLTGVFSIDQASTATDGYLTAVDWNIFNSKQDALVIGNTTTTTSGITIGGGVGSVIGAGLTIDIQNATGLQNGLLTSADWTIFNSKENGIVAGLATDYWRGDKTWSDFNTDVSANPDVAANTAARHNAVTIGTANGLSIDPAQALSLATADAVTTGALTAADWTTFNNKQNALVIGDVTTTTTGVTIGGGVGSIIGGGLTIDIATADAATTGLLTSGDWTIFNAKQDALTAGNSIKIVANVIDTIQNIRTTDSPTFAGLTLNGDLLTSGLVDGIDLSAKAIDWDATKTKLDLLTYTLEGHGGGLDADTLDGFHASDFMSINGGSLNGTITTNVTNNGADTSIGLTISSANSAGNGTTGMGTSMMFALENATGVTQTSGEINNKWTNLNPGSQSSAITLKSWVNGLYRDALKIDNGVLTVPGAYNTIVGQPNRALYIDATGRIGYVASSERYKNSIADMEDIGWLYSLRPVNYVYNSDESGVKQYGLIAEEVAAVNSLFVSYNEDGSIETVNYNSFIPVLIKAVQDNKTSINGLSTTTDKIGLKLNDTSTALETAIATITDQQSQIENLQSDIANLNNTVSNIAASVNTNSEVTETAPITTTSSDEDIINLTDALNALTSEVNTLKVDMNTFRNAISVNALTGDATFMGHIYVNGDTAGKSEIAVGLTEIEVVFAKPYVGAPIINATPLDFITGQYKIAEVKSTGFKIVLSEAQATTVEFNWNALGR